MKQTFLALQISLRQTARAYLRYPPIQTVITVAATLISDMKRSDLMRQAGGMAYVTLLSLVPSLTAIFALISIFKPILGEGSALTERLQEFIIDNLAQGAGEQAITYLNDFLGAIDVAKIGITSFIGLLISLVLLLKQIEAALNRIWQINHHRNLFTRFVYFWTFLTLGTFIASLAFGLLSGFSLDSILNLNPDQTAKVVSNYGKTLLGISSGFVFFYFMYKIVPNCLVSSRGAAVGALVASVLFHQASQLFSLYVKYFSNHKAIYGALAALPVFLTWLYIIWLIILLGSVISWRFQQGLPLEEKERDETSYSPKQKMHFWRLQSLLPFFILVSIHNKFKTGDGKGINAITLAQQLNVSNQWIVEALKVLEDLNYIAAAQHQDAEMILEQTYFPTVPPEKIPSQKVVKELLEPTEYWLKNHKFPTSEPIRQVLSGFTKPSTEHPEKPTNLADMLAKIEAPAASQ